MKLKRLGLRIGLGIAGAMLAAGCAGVAVPVGGGLIDTVELPALPQVNLFPAAETAHSMGHAAQAIGRMASYTYVSPYSLCEH